MELCFTNSFTANARIWPKLYGRVQHQTNFNLVLLGYLADTPITTKADASVKAIWPSH